MALSPRQMKGVQERNDIVVTNPHTSVIARTLPRDIAHHHVGRAAQILTGFQSAGRFERDPAKFNTFVGKGAANIHGDTSAFRRPPNTTRKSLATVMDYDWAERFLPFPGRIYFVSAGGEDLLAACQMFLSLFNKYVTRGGDSAKKNHTYRLATSLVTYVNDTLQGGLPQNLADGEVGDTVKFINVAPHAATMELIDAAMWKAARDTMRTYGPGIAVSYDFINSDALGRFYGAGTGGPRNRQVVYALPMVTLWIPEAGRGGARMLRPHGLVIGSRTKGGRPRFRKRTGIKRTLRTQL